MILLLLFQVLSWGVLHLFLVVLILHEIHLWITVPLYVSWFWLNFWLCSYLNGVIATRSMRKWLNREGTLDPYIRMFKMYIGRLIWRN